MIEEFKLFWTFAYILGCGAFAVMACVVIPLGARDLLRLLRELRQDKE